MAQIVLSKSSDPAIISSFIVASNKDSSRQVDLAPGISVLQYHESILAETVRITVNYTDSGHAIPSEDGEEVVTAVEGLPIVGTETVKVKIEDNNQNEIDMKLYINKVTPIKETSKVTTVALELVSKEFILNEKIRVNTRFDGKISDHVTKIFQGAPAYLDTEKDLDIEETDNNYNFIGNNRKPFFVLNTLSKKSVPSGKLGKSAGFFFWETSEGFKFKSIDTLLDKEKNPIKKSILFDNTFDDDGANIPPGYDMKAFEYSEENRVNIKEKLLLERLRIELEDNTSKNGVVPFQNFGENTFDSLAISSDILSEEGLSVALEDSSGPDHILLDGTNENAENAGFFLIDESETGFQILFESVETGHSDNTGVIIFDGTDSSSSDAGDKALFELQTRSDILNNSSYSVPGIPSFDSVSITIDSSLDMSIV